MHPVDQLDRLGDRHFFGCGDDDQSGACCIAKDLQHPVGLVAHHAHLHQFTDRPRGIDLGDDVAAGLGIDDDEVIVAFSHLMTQLADAKDLLDAGCSVGDEVERVRQRPDATDQWDADEQPQILLQRVFGVHHHRPQPGLHFGGLEAQLAHLERCRERALRIHLADESSLSLTHRKVGERGGDAGLAGATFAADKQQLPIEQGCHRGSAITRGDPRWRGAGGIGRMGSCSSARRWNAIALHRSIRRQS